MRGAISTVAAFAVAVSATGQQSGTKPGDDDAAPLSLTVRPALESALPQPLLETLAIPTPPSGTWGVVAYGTGGGAIFRDSDSEAEAWLGTNATGVRGFGSLYGGVFADSDGTGAAGVGYGNAGVYAFGNSVGGYLFDSDSSGEAWIGYGDIGVSARGNSAGGYFRDEDETGRAYVGDGHTGISGLGDLAGGYFQDNTSSNSAHVAFSTYKISGSGTVSFVQNHPDDPAAVIVYAAPEGDEVATYTRGTARLEAGEARVTLGESFRWVTNPDLGLTAHLTPRGDCNGVYVASLSTDELVVREIAGGDSDVVVDYLVYGLRIGFEDSTVVQEKQREAWIPSMADHRELLARRPELARYTARSRFLEQRRELGMTEALDTSRSEALVAAIHEFDPAVDTVERRESEPPAPLEQWSRSELPQPRESGDAQREARRQVDPSGADTPPPVMGAEDVRARSFRPSSADLSAMMRVTGTVEPGDVLVVGSDGTAVRSDTASAPTVLGVVAAEPGVVLGDNGRAEPRAPLVFSGIASCKVDAAYGPIYPGDLLVTSPTPGHAMRADVPSPGTVLGKALEEHTDGAGTIRVLVMLR